MCYICDGIAEPCGWQRAQKLGSALEAYFAEWEEPLCQHCDEGPAEFVDELAKFRDQGCQAGQPCLTLQASQGRKEAAPGRPPPTERPFPSGRTAPQRSNSPKRECT